jgi:hypothetical protein
MRHVIGAALDLMASRCAWLGACANAGAAVANIAATESHGASFVARFNVLIILNKSFCRRRKPPLQPSKNFAVKILTARIIFAFGFHCKRIVAIFMGWRERRFF